MSITQQDILDSLTKLKNKDRGYLQPDDYKKFLPNAIPGIPKGADTSMYTAKVQSIMDRSNSATLLAQVKSQNTRDYNQMLEAQQAMKRAKSNLSAAGSMSFGNLTKQGPTQSVNMGSGPQPSNGALGRVGVGQNLGTYDWNGKKPGGQITVNNSVASRFTGFLQALAATGYKINSLGTYANRKIEGTNVTSLHAYGLAMDINPAQNPVSYNHVVTDLPKGIGQLASKYGLVWGGDWNHSKKDAMHFSVPYGGTK